MVLERVVWYFQVKLPYSTQRWSVIIPSIASSYCFVCSRNTFTCQSENMSRSLWVFKMVLELGRSGLLQAYIHFAWGLWEGKKILLSPKIIYSSRGCHPFYYFKRPSNQAEILVCGLSLCKFSEHLLTVFGLKWVRATMLQVLNWHLILLKTVVGSWF